MIFVVDTDNENISAADEVYYYINATKSTLNWNAGGSVAKTYVGKTRLT
jgi:hypothetical protein